MADTITRSVMDSLGSNGIDAVAAISGTDRASTTKTLGLAIPTTLAGMLPLVSSDSGTMNRLFDLVRGTSGSIGRPDDLAAPLATPAGARSLFDQGGSILEAIFGARHVAVTDAVAHRAGVGSGIAASILRIGACALVSTLGSLIASRNLDARGFGRTLLGERSSLAAALPPSLFGLATGGMIGDRVVDEKRDRAVIAPVHTASSRRNWLAPAAFLGLVAIGGYTLLRSRQHASEPPVTASYEPEPPMATPPPGMPVTRAPAPAAPVARGGGPEDTAVPAAPIEQGQRMDERAMPANAPVAGVGAADANANAPGANAVDPNANAAGANANAADANANAAGANANAADADANAAGANANAANANAEDANGAGANAAGANAVGAPFDGSAARGGGPAGAVQGSNFGPLNFAFGSHDLTPASREHFDQLVSTLQARPNARVQLIGHTDNVGDASYNQRLSEDRAETIKSMLVSRGIDASRIDATTGRSLDEPTRSNDSAEGRAANRRTDVIISP